MTTTGNSFSPSNYLSERSGLSHQFPFSCTSRFIRRAIGECHESVNSYCSD